MTLTNALMIFAVLLSPFLAVFAQKQIESWRSKRDIKLWVFKTLMATRAETVSPLHVQALNMIDIEFSEKNEKEKEVRRLWKEYLDHLASLPKDAEQKNLILPVWSEKNLDDLAELLVAMGKCFGHNIDKVTIKRGIYSPAAHNIIEIEQRLIRYHALQLLMGKSHILTRTSLDESEAILAKKFRGAIEDLIDGRRDFKVTVKHDEPNK